MRGIEVRLVQREIGAAEDFVRDVGEEGVPLLEEGVESSSEAVIVEFVWGNVPEILHAVFLGPRGDVDESRRARQACGQENGKDGAVRELGFGGDRAIHDGGDVELVEQGPQHRKGAASDDADLSDHRVRIDKRHGSSVLQARAEGDGVDQRRRRIICSGQGAAEKRPGDGRRA